MPVQRPDTMPPAGLASELSLLPRVKVPITPMGAAHLLIYLYHSGKEMSRNYCKNFILFSASKLRNVLKATKNGKRCKNYTVYPRILHPKGAVKSLRGRFASGEAVPAGDPKHSECAVERRRERSAIFGKRLGRRQSPAFFWLFSTCWRRRLTAWLTACSGKSLRVWRVTSLDSRSFRRISS